MKSKKTLRMAEIALMSAVLCVLAPIAMPVPFSPVPITFGTFAVYLTATVLGKKFGTISVAVYLLIGLAGLPVFSGFSAGFTKLLGPGGGYMIGYLPCAFLIGMLMEGKGKQGIVWWQKTIRAAIVMALGAACCYSVGTAWFLVVMDGTYGLAEALFLCVVPFLPFELIKILLAALTALPVKEILKRSGML